MQNDGEDGKDGEPHDGHHVIRSIYARHVGVLLIDDDPVTAGEFVGAARESVLDISVDVATSLDEGIAYLARSTGLGLRRRVLPDIAVSALSIIDSHQFLARVRADERYDTIPLLVLAPHSDSRLERRSFALGAAGHLEFPRQHYERVALIHALPDFMPLARAAQIRARMPR